MVQRRRATGKATRRATSRKAPAKPTRKSVVGRPARSAAPARRASARGAPAGGILASKPLTFRFKPGDRVMTRKDRPKGHCRTPSYLRGQPGVIERCLGHFRNPEQLAYGKPGLPKVPLYMVRYEIPKLWKGYEGSRKDTLVADIYEFWLDPA